MKSLRAFWHWVDNEKPAEVGENQFDRLTYEEQRSVGVACELVLERIDSDFDDYDDCACVDWRAFNALRDHWPAVRDLSFVICSGIEAMHEAVPEPEPSAADAFLAERYRNEVQLPDVVMNGSKAFACPGCGLRRCDGTHVNCDMEAFLAANPNVRARLTGPIEPLQNWIPAKLANMPAHTVLGRKTLTEDGLQLLRPEPRDYVYRREYQGEWLTEQQLAMNRPQHALGMQRAALSGDITVHGGANAGQILWRACGLEAQAERVYVGQLRSHYDGPMRRLEIYTTLTVLELERFRGISPETIRLRGKPEQYAPQVRAYMSEVILPMHIDGAPIHTPDYAELTPFFE
jgi:hypothetical protein